MNTVFQKLKNLDKAIKEKEINWSKQSKDKHKLEQERTKVFLEFALKEGLKQNHWLVEYHKDYYTGSVSFGLTASFSDFPKLMKAMGDRYFTNTTLTRGVTLFIKEGTLSIAFEDISKVKSFIDKHELSLDFGAVTHEYENILQQKTDLEDLFTKYGVAIE